MPGWTFFVAIALAFVAALTTSAHVQLKSTRSGDGLLKTWIKGGIFGGLAMICVIAAFLLFANLVNWLG